MVVVIMTLSTCGAEGIKDLPERHFGYNYHRSWHWEWMIQITGLQENKEKHEWFFENFRDDEDENALKKPFETSDHRRIYVTSMSDQDLKRGFDNKMPIAAVAKYLNMMDNMGLKVVNSVGLSSTAEWYPQAPFYTVPAIVWTLQG